LRSNLRQHGPRPLNPMRDLGAVADLLEAVFGRNLDASGRRMIREARMMSRIGPLLYLLSPFSQASAGLNPGLVWEEDDKIVGNVTIMPSQNRSGRWQMANVAVHPDYRRRGIATRLLDATIEHVRQRNGCSVSLQVKGDSTGVALYEQLGFQSLGAVTRWQLTGRLQLDQILAQSRPLRKARRDDWTAIWRLFCSASPAARGWPEPLSEKDFRPNIRRWAADLLAGHLVKRWVSPGATAAGLDGYVELQTWPGAKTQLTLRVRPEASGQLEGDLLVMALRHLSRRGYPEAVIDHPAGDVPAEGRLREAGFRPLRTLLLMQLEMGDE